MDVFVHITEELPAVWTSASERLRIGRYIFAPQNENMLVELCKISLYSGQEFTVFIITRLTSVFSLTTWIK